MGISSTKWNDIFKILNLSDKGQLFETMQLQKTKIGLNLSNGHSPQIRENGELLVRMWRGESHFSQKRPLASVGESGEYSQNGLASVGESGESTQHGLANVGESGESVQHGLANVGEFGEYSPSLLANVGTSPHDKIGRF